MKNLIIYMLIVAFLLAQGLRICIHASDMHHVRTAHAGFVHYESDSDPHGDTGKDQAINYVSSGLESLDTSFLLTGLSAFAILLVSLLLMAGSKQRYAVPRSVPLLSFRGCHLRPPLRAPPF